MNENSPDTTFMSCIFLFSSPPNISGCYATLFPRFYILVCTRVPNFYCVSLSKLFFFFFQLHPATTFFSFFFFNSIVHSMLCKKMKHTFQLKRGRQCYIPAYFRSNRSQKTSLLQVNALLKCYLLGATAIAKQQFFCKNILFLLDCLPQLLVAYSLTSFA